MSKKIFRLTIGFATKHKDNTKVIFINIGIEPNYDGDDDDIKLRYLIIDPGDLNVIILKNFPLFENIKFISVCELSL